MGKHTRKNIPLEDLFSSSRVECLMYPRMDTMSGWCPKSKQSRSNWELDRQTPEQPVMSLRHWKASFAN